MRPCDAGAASLIQVSILHPMVTKV